MKKQKITGRKQHFVKLDSVCRNQRSMYPVSAADQHKSKRIRVPAIAEKRVSFGFLFQYPAVSSGCDMDLR